MNLLHLLGCKLSQAPLNFPDMPKGHSPFKYSSHTSEVVAGSFQRNGRPHLTVAGGVYVEVGVEVGETEGE